MSTWWARAAEHVLLTWSSSWLELEPDNVSGRMIPFCLHAKEDCTCSPAENAPSSRPCLLCGQNPANFCCIHLTREAEVTQGRSKLTFLANGIAQILPSSGKLSSVRFCTSLSPYVTQASHEGCSPSLLWQKQRSSVPFKSRPSDFSQQFNSYEI